MSDINGIAVRATVGVGDEAKTVINFVTSSSEDEAKEKMKEWAAAQGYENISNIECSRVAALDDITKF